MSDYNELLKTIDDALAQTDKAQEPKNPTQAILDEIDAALGEKPEAAPVPSVTSAPVPSVTPTPVESVTPAPVPSVTPQPEAAVTPAPVAAPQPSPTPSPVSKPVAELPKPSPSRLPEPTPPKEPEVDYSLPSNQFLAMVKDIPDEKWGKDEINFLNTLSGKDLIEIKKQRPDVIWDDILNQKMFDYQRETTPYKFPETKEDFYNLTKAVSNFVGRDIPVMASELVGDVLVGGAKAVKQGVPFLLGQTSDYAKGLEAEQLLSPEKQQEVQAWRKRAWEIANTPLKGGEQPNPDSYTDAKYLEKIKEGLTKEQIQTLDQKYEQKRMEAKQVPFETLAPLADLPVNLGFLGTKLATGGFQTWDSINEQFGLLTKEQAYERWKTRELLDSVKAKMAKEEPRAWARGMDVYKPIYAPTLSYFASLSTPSVEEMMIMDPKLTKEEAESKRKATIEANVLDSIEETKKSIPEADPELQAFGEVAIPGGFGLDPFGYALNVVNAAKKLTPIARLKLKKLRYTDDEINALESKAQRVLKEKQLKELESKKTAGLVERAAGATAKGIEATGEYLERSPKFQTIAKYTPYVTGIGLGYEIDPENPLRGMIAGGLTAAGVKAGFKTLKETPKVIKEISAARRISAGGEMGPLATLESIAKQQDEVKNLTAKLKTLSEGTEEYIDTKKLLDDAKDKAKGIKEGGGEVVDYEGIGKVSDTTKNILRFASDDLISNIGEYAKMGIEPTILGLSMGMIDSSDEEELKGMIGSGLVFSLGGRAMQQGFHKFLGEDPVIAARKSRQASMDALKAYRDSSPETQGEIDRLTDWTNVLQRQENKIGQAQSDLQSLQAEGASPDKIKKAEKVLSAEQKSLSLLKTANVQTRNEFGKNFLQQLARNNMLINGSLKAGQNNVGFHILSTQQIFDHFRKKPEYRDVSDEDLMMSATQQGFYSGTGGNEYRPGMEVSDAAKGLVFDTSKPSIVVNSDALQNRMMIFGETPTEALNHETGHHFARIPEIQNAMGDARKVLFTNEIKDASGAVKEISNGLYSEKQLNEMFVKDYLKNRPKDQVAEIAKNLGVWDYNTNSLNTKDVGSYMQEEILAELFSNTLSRNLGKNLDSKQLHLLDVARLKMKNNLLKNAVTKVLGLGASSDVVSELTNAKLPPEAQSAARNAVRLIQSMNGDFSTMASMPQAAPISKAEIKKSKIAAERYGMDSGLFATKVVAQVFDADGNPVGAAVDVNDPSVYEGSWRISKDGEERLSGYGQIPVQLRQLQVPEGGTLSIAKQVATEVDGVTPKLLNPKDIKKLQQDRASLFKQAIDTPDYGTPGRFEAVSEGSQTYRGSFTPMQIKAIQDLPEGIVPLKIKKYLLDLNEAIVKKDGTRFYVDYAAVMDDKGNYKAFSPKIYDVVPIGLHLSKDGNFLVTTISAGRMIEKLNLWSDRMPNRLNPWGGSKEAFWADFSKKYLDNWTKGIEGSGYDKQGQPIGTNQLDADVQAAEVKKSILNDFLNLFTNETQALNLDRTTIPKRKGDPKNKSLDRTIMSMRIDHMAELLDADHLPKLPIDYEKAKLNFMPASQVEAETNRAKFLSAELEKMYEEGGTDKRIANYESELEGIYQKLESDQESTATEGEENITEYEMNPQDVVFEAINNYKTGKVDNQQQTLAEHIRNVFDSEGKFNISPSVTDAEIESAANDIYNQKTAQRQKITGLQFMPAETERYPTSERGMYSGLQKTIDQKVQGKFASPDQLKAIVTNPQNAKAEELKWSGVLVEIDRLAAENNGKVPKDKVMDYLRNEGAVKFEEVVSGLDNVKKIAKKYDLLINDKYGAIIIQSYKGKTIEFENAPEELQDALNTYLKPKFAKYQLPGGTNYREVVMTMPIPKEKASYEVIQKGDLYYPTDIVRNISQSPYPTFDQANAQVDRLNKTAGERTSKESYTSSHFPDTPNYVAHMRLNERTDAQGNEGLFVEELQSDRHQAGREKGYQEPLTQEQTERREFLRSRSMLMESEGVELGDLNRIALGGVWDERTPDAPFRKDWSIQLFKRALRDAVDSDKKWIGWTTGIEQVKRYEQAMRQAVDEITWNTPKGYQKAFAAIKDGNTILTGKINDDGTVYDFSYDSNFAEAGADANGKQLSEVLGKEVASKILAENSGTATGDDLTVGGEGMKGFYDTILPKEIGKYVAKMGGKVDKSEITTQKESTWTQVTRTRNAVPKTKISPAKTTPIWRVDITPEMAGKVRGGQLQFMPADSDYLNLAKDPEKNREQLQGMVDVAAKPSTHTFIDASQTQSNKIRWTNSANNQIEFYKSQIAKLPSVAEATNEYKALVKAWNDAGLSQTVEDTIKGIIELKLQPPPSSLDEYLQTRIYLERKGAEAEIKKSQETLSRAPKGKTETEFKTGRPTIVKAYHSTPFGRLTEFSDEMLGRFTGAPSATKAHFFAGSPSVSETYFADDAWMLNHKGFFSLSGEQKKQLIDSAREELQNGLDSRPDEIADLAMSLFDIDTYDTSPYENVKHDVYIRLNNPLVYDFKGAGYRDVSYNDLLVKAAEGGHDGVIMANTTDPGPASTLGSFPEPTNIIAVLRGHSSKIKSADPVTYDDNGNAVPLSQRFNPKTSDIRFMPAEQPTEYEPISARIRPLEGISAPTKVVGAKALSLGEIEPPVRGKAMLPDIELKPDISEKGIQSSDKTGLQFMPAEGERPTKNMPQSALNVLYADSKDLPKPDKKITNAKVALALADIAERTFGGKITSSTITPEIIEDFALNGANEAEAALKSSGKNAANWYSTAIKAALAVAGTIHRALSDIKVAKQNQFFAKEYDPVRAAQFALRLPLAITSQNVNVPLNTEYAELQFNHFQETGKFDIKQKHGSKAPAISSNLNLANVMIDKLGSILALEDFVKKEFTVRDLEIAASKIAGKKITISGLKDDIVNGAAIFGPKIGQGFLQNLMGKFDPVTIDLWMRRTWGRWTGDVVGDGVTGQRLARIIEEYKSSKRVLPDFLKDIKTEMRSLGTKSNGDPTKPELTISEDIESKIENDSDFRKGIEQFSKEANAEFQIYYKLMGEPMTKKSIDNLVGSIQKANETQDADESKRILSTAYNKLISDQSKIKSQLDSEWSQLTPAQKKELNKQDPTKAISKEKWKADQHILAKRTETLQNEQKNIIKPKWANAAKSIIADLNPIDIPSDIDRKVITIVVNKIRQHLEERGYDVTNADVQAILWYPEKDLWAKLRGEEESNLKQSYDDEFLKIAEERGVGKEARRVAKEIRGY